MKMGWVMKIRQSAAKIWAREKLRGIENCIFPSFTLDFTRLDESGIRHDVRQSIAHGFCSTVCAVEAGLTFDEAKQFVAIVADEAAGKISVSVNLIFNTMDQSIEMARHAAASGCQTALIGYPFNYQPDGEEELIADTRRIAESADLKFFLYPSEKFGFGRFHPGGFPLSAIEKLLDVDAVAGIKMGIVDPGFMAEIYRRYNDEVIIEYPWERWFPLLAHTYGLQFVGAGAYELFQSPQKRYLVEYFNLLLEGSFDAAMDIYWMLTPVRMVFEKQFMPTRELGTYHWPQQKYYQWLVGGNGGYTRQPVMKLAAHEREEARAALRAIGIEPRENDHEFFASRNNFDQQNGGAGA
jgi:4-hydroxy-tetrahydrodipicolinate synthase